ncbi:MAG TPA: tetratricopeptide repeat protein [Gemmatimonadota bacterium]|nr:tetratricopeptide repeat protein [Gemmatimonadota bacterium]
MWYAVAAWVLIQVAETTFPYLGLPEVAVTLVIVLAVAGLPVALVLSWIFDITSGGIEETAPAPLGRPQAADAGADPPTLRLAAPLPHPATPLLGRDSELEEAERLLTGDEVRLLTVVGPGGSGKTRLALELAHRVAPHLRDRAAWVRLDAIRDPALVPSAIGRAFGIGESGDEELMDTIAASLRERELLVVLDNFEQVVEAARHVAELLAACPELRVLVTSRAPLRLRGERALPLRPLPAPDPGRPPAELMSSPAVRLFADRASDVDPSFEVTEENVPRIAEICRRLDGLPLALELAAARSKVLGPEAILARLEQRMPLLDRGARDHLPHQRTLRDTIAWSHELLGPDERVLFRRLAVFSGGWDLAAVQPVAGGGLESDVLDLFQALVDQSLVSRASEAGPDPRFTMLEVIREYAAHALESAGEAAAARDRHAAHFATLARTAEPQLVGPPQAEWLDRLEREHDNLRAALDWLESRDPVSGLRLAGHLWRFWEVRGHLSEGRRRLASLLEAAPAVDDGKLRLKALYAAGILADAQGDYDGAREHFERSLAAYREAGDRWGVANALNNMGVVALRHGDYATAHELYTRSVSLWRKLGNDAAVALALNNLGNVARLRGDHDAARTSLEESLAMQEAAGDVNGCALTLGLLAEVALEEDSLGEAERLYEESLSLFRESGNRPEIARSLLELGRVQRARGRPGDARARWADALLEYAELGSPRGLAGTLEELAALAGAEGADEERASFAEAARALRERGQEFDPEAVIEDAHRWASAAQSP